MYKENKYITIMTGEPFIEYPSKIYLDYFTAKADLKRHYKANNEFFIGVGFFGCYITIIFKYGFVSRPPTKEEKEREREIELALQGL